MSKDIPATIRPRTVLIGLICVVILCAITPYNNHFLRNSKIAGNHLPVSSIFALLFLVFLVNIPLRKLKEQLALKPAELTTIWLMIIVAVGIPSAGFLQSLLPTLVAPTYFATLENSWSETLHPHIPRWLCVWDANAVTNFYEGIEAGEAVPFLIWLKPLLVWTLFILVFYFTTLCLSTLIRKQWIERERFSFPLVQIPLEIVAEPPSGAKINAFFKNRLLWMGMLLPVILHLINGLHAYFPQVPEIPRIYHVYRAFHDKPWHTLGWWPAMRIAIFFSVIGITALLTLEVSFSLWFFFLFFKLQYVIMNALGWGISPWVSCSRQIMGGHIIFAPAVFWTAREHIADVWRKTVSAHSTVDDTDEPLPYRVASLGFLLGFVTLVLFCYIAGISLWIAALTLMLAFTTSIVLSWMVVNGGLLLVQAPFYPSQYLQFTLGSSVIGPKSLAVLSFQRGFFRNWTEFMMPNFLHSFKVSEEVAFSRRKIIPILALSIGVAIAVSSYTSLDLIYHKGASYLTRGVYVNQPRNIFRAMNRMIQFPVETKWDEVYSMIAGAGFTSVLLFLRHRFIWWPLHPIGYLLGATSPPFHLWSSVFIGWLIKYSVLKFGGASGVRTLRPIALGLIFGEFLMVGLWMILGLFTGVGYFALPG
ncbi:hypothetical protein IH992_25875 [Candidatus Poribacteria bacterium]|nr:hypothetical protein [Candidatus Poribacteria bacterium]